MAWSIHQERIFDFITNEKGNGIINAVAGSGKTTTIVAGMELIPYNQSKIFLAFNKAIAEELKSRGVNAKTFHSLGCSPLMRFKNVRTVTSNKTYKVMQTICNPDDLYMYHTFVTRLIGLAKQIGTDVLVPNEKAVYESIAEHHDIELETENSTLDRAYELCVETLDACNEAAMIDFDDMIYLPVRERLHLPLFDFILVDEAQDTNPIQRELLRMILKPYGRLIAVGDPAQAIYGFRGADSTALQTLGREFNCTNLSLSISYRCSRSVVEYAKQWVDHIEHAPHAPKGGVHELGISWDLDIFKPKDLVVCRTTRPLVSLAFKLIASGKTAFILGKDLGYSLIRLVTKQGAETLEELEAKIEHWKEIEMAAALNKNLEGKALAIEDKAECLLFLIDNFKKDVTGTISKLLDMLERLFQPNQEGITLATIHKSKGLEANRVFWLNRSQCPSPRAQQKWQLKQEENLCYVATTRARHHLAIIEETGNEN